MIHIEGFVFIIYIVAEKYLQNVFFQFYATLHILQCHLEQDVEYSYNYFHMLP